MPCYHIFWSKWAMVQVSSTALVLFSHISSHTLWLLFPSLSYLVLVFFDPGELWLRFSSLFDFILMLLICRYWLLFLLLLCFVLGCFDLKELLHRFSAMICSYFHIHVDPCNISSPFNTIRPYNDSYWSTSISGTNSCMIWLKIIYLIYIDKLSLMWFMSSHLGRYVLMLTMICIH